MALVCFIDNITDKNGSLRYNVIAFPTEHVNICAIFLTADIRATDSRVRHMLWIFSLFIVI